MTLPANKNSNGDYKCYSCAYKKNVPGNAHIKCVFDWEKSENKKPRGNSHGIKNGWYIFPYLYDPRWMIEDCPVYCEKADPEWIKEQAAFDDLISLLG